MLEIDQCVVLRQGGQQLVDSDTRCGSSEAEVNIAFLCSVSLGDIFSEYSNAAPGNTNGKERQAHKGLVQQRKEIG